MSENLLMSERKKFEKLMDDLVEASQQFCPDDDPEDNAKHRARESEARRLLGAAFDKVCQDRAEVGAIADLMLDAIRGKPVSDFAESFPAVAEALDTYAALSSALAERDRLRKAQPPPDLARRVEVLETALRWYVDNDEGDPRAFYSAGRERARAALAGAAQPQAEGAPATMSGNLVMVAEAFARTAEAAVSAFENRNARGMQVPYHGDFANANPSIIVRLRWWAREFRTALAAAPRPETPPEEKP
jgi:hypothetical protein